MPYRVDWVLLCDDLKYDPSTKKFSAFGLWDYRSAPGFPARARFVVLVRFREVEGEQGENGRGEVYMRLVGPVASSGEFDAGAAPGATFAIAETEKTVIALNPFVSVYYYPAEFDIHFPVPGEYQLEFYFDDVLAHTCAFDVVPEGT